jgi:cytochrome c-type biogenesis protein CcmH/NrfF
LKEAEYPLHEQEQVMKGLTEKMHCPECDKEIENKAELSKHMKKAHPDEEMEEKIKSYIQQNDSLKLELEATKKERDLYKNRKIKVEVK